MMKCADSHARGILLQWQGQEQKKKGFLIYEEYEQYALLICMNRKLHIANGSHER